MTTASTARSSRAGGAGRVKRPLKSPLAVHGDLRPSPGVGGQGEDATLLRDTVLSDRAATLAEFEDYLRTTNSRDGRPYEEATVNAYVSPGKTLDAWLAAEGLDGDFTACGTATLNRFFREYYLEHGQGGTHTLQRNCAARASAARNCSAWSCTRSRPTSSGTRCSAWFRSRARERPVRAD
jgi:hypothetical protein